MSKNKIADSGETAANIDGKNGHAGTDKADNASERHREVQRQLAILRKKRRRVWILAIAGTAILAAALSAFFIIKAARDPDKDVVALSVNTVAQIKPEDFEGEITITGINAGTYEDDPSIFFLMDTEELLVCKNFGCGAVQLPMRYEGDVPEVADEVNVTGRWGKYVVAGREYEMFEVTRVKVKRNVMDLLQ